MLDSHSFKDEEIDCLALLSEDHGLDGPSKGFETSCVQLATRRINDRTPTRELHSSSHTVIVSSLEPWELGCLNHHNRWICSGPSDGREPANDSGKKNCFQFLQPDFNFVASWDRSRGDMVEEWFDIETSFVVCATLLSMRLASESTSPTT